MSIRTKYSVAILALGTFIALGLGIKPALAETVIRFSYALPVTHNFHKGAEQFKKAVEDGTGGEVKIEIYPSGQLSKDSNFIKGITSGTLDAGLSPTLYWTGVMPIAGIFDVPYLVRSHEEAKKVLASDVGQVLLDKLDAFNSVGLGYFNYGFGIFGNNVRSLKTPADFKGLKIRTNNDIGAELLQTFGASPTFMSGSEVYLGLQRGTVDGAHTGLSSVLSRKIYEVMKHLTVDNHNMIPYFFIVRKDIFEGLSPANQQILRQAARDACAWVADAQEADDVDAAKKLSEEHGMDVVILDDAALQQWSKEAAPVTDFWLAKVGDDGRSLIEKINTTLGR
jgi:tripartite ATP-independent transporter DctP family solute receptor